MPAVAPKPKPTAHDVTPYRGTTPVPDPTRTTVDTSGIRPIVADGVDGRSGQFAKVEPAALTAIASALDRVIGPLATSTATLSDIHVKPGHFNQAANLQTLVGEKGSNTGLVDTYSTNMTSVHDAFTAMVAALKSLGASYQSADEMTTSNANDVQSALAKVVTALGGTAPTTIPGYTPPTKKPRAQ